MGAWSYEPFDNDDAMDWIEEFGEAPNIALVESALQAVIQSDEYPEADLCFAAIAAAEVVAALRGKPSREFLETELLCEDLEAPSEALVASAKRAVESIANASELRDLWQESDEFDAWYATLDGLLLRLS